MPITCKACGLVNPDGSIRCDCGRPLGAGVRKRSPHVGRWIGLAVPALVLLAIGLWWPVTSQRPTEVTKPSAEFIEAALAALESIEKYERAVEMNGDAKAAAPAADDKTMRLLLRKDLQVGTVSMLRDYLAKVRSFEASHNDDARDAMVQAREAVRTALNGH